MTTLRRTQRLASALPITPGEPPPPETALGDWYATRLVVDRRPLVLLVSERTLCPIVTPARDVASLPDRLPELVRRRLLRMGIDPALVAAEVAVMRPIHVAKTASRSVNGILVEFAAATPGYLPVRAWDNSTLPFIEARLAETPCFATRRFEEVVFPARDTPIALQKRWAAQR